MPFHGVGIDFFWNHTIADKWDGCLRDDKNRIPVSWVLLASSTPFPSATPTPTPTLLPFEISRKPTWLYAVWILNVNFIRKIFYHIPYIYRNFNKRVKGRTSFTQTLIIIKLFLLTFKLFVAAARTKSARMLKFQALSFQTGRQISYITRY